MDSDAFLKLMGYLESTNNPNAQHKEMTEGMHKGTSALGEYGMMPKTIQDQAKARNKDALDSLISESDPSNVEQILKDNPDRYKEYVKALAQKLQQKTGGDPALSATGWLYGHNLSKEEMQDKLNADPEYKKRIEKAIMEKHLMSAPQNFIDTLPNITKPTLQSK